jgi:geranylgeranyl diphosphate synthase type II
MSCDVNSVEALGEFRADFDRRFQRYLESDDSIPDRLKEAVLYCARAPGKRVRPYLVVRCCELVGGKRDDAWPVAVAVECVHAFSLIHDDLPAMDNDDFRRGQPTCHKKFGEAMAILAGDALVVLAFELLTTRVPDLSLAARLAGELGRGIGWCGMIGGQAEDILGEDQAPSVALTRSIYNRKTACLFASSCRLGAMVGRGSNDQVSRLGRFGEFLGHAFQIADDLLDVTEEAGGPAGAESGGLNEARKQTLPRCIGAEASRHAARQAVDEAVALLATFGPAADDLRALGRYVIERDY